MRTRRNFRLPAYYPTPEPFLTRDGLQQRFSEAADLLARHSRIQGSRARPSGFNMPVAIPNLSPAAMTEMNGRFASVNIIELFDHRIVGAGRKLKCVHLRRVGKQGDAARIGKAPRFDWRHGARGHG